MTRSSSFGVAAVQACPVYLDLDRTIDKACRLVAEAADSKADLVVFPETFVPGYPLWVWFIPPGRTADLRAAYSRLHTNSIAIPSPAVERLCDAARDAGAAVTIGINHVAKEGRAVTIGCCQAVRKDDIPDSLAFKSRYLADVGEWIDPCGSVIVDPDGKILAGPANETESILYADIESDQLVGPRWQLDIAGHNARPDVFELIVHRRPKPMARESAARRGRSPRRRSR